MTSYPLRFDFPVTAGASHTLSLTWREGSRPVDVVGWSARLQVRQRPGSPLLVDLGTASGSIVLHPGGLIIAEFSPVHTAALLGATSPRYDLRLDDGAGRVVFLLAGAVKVRAPITSGA
jgi:hypothetical protein